MIYKAILIGPTLEKDFILHAQLGKELVVNFYENMEIFCQSQEKNKPDVAIIEIESKKNQLDSLVRFHDKYPELPIIAIGSGKPKENLIQAFKKGIKDYFKTPYHVNLLVDRVTYLAHSKNKKQTRSNNLNHHNINRNSLLEN